MKKWFVRFMLVIMVLSISACSNSKENSSEISKEESSSVQVDPAKLDQVMLGVRWGMTPEEVEKAVGKESEPGEGDSICIYDVVILDFRFDRLQYWFLDGKLDSIEYWLEGTGTGNTKIQTRDFSKNVASVFGDPVESEVTLAWFQKWILDDQTKISVGHNFGETYCTVAIQKIEEE